MGECFLISHGSHNFDDRQKSIHMFYVHFIVLYEMGSLFVEKTQKLRLTRLINFINILDLKAKSTQVNDLRFGQTTA